MGYDSEPRKRKGLYENVIKEIYQYINTNELLPGDKLPSESEFSRLLGVSRNTVREAARILQSLGIIQSGQRTGMIIQEFSISHLSNFFPNTVGIINTSTEKILEARLWYETSIIDFIIANATPDDIENMRNAMVPMISACLNDDGGTFLQTDIDFHREYYKCIHNKILYGLGEIVLAYAEVSARETQLVQPSTLTMMIMTLEEHKKIIQFVEEGNKDDLMQIIKTVHFMAPTNH